jgi:hypothetical protein
MHLYTQFLREMHQITSLYGRVRLVHFHEAPFSSSASSVCIDCIRDERIRNEIRRGSKHFGGKLRKDVTWKTTVDDPFSLVHVHHGRRNTCFCRGNDLEPPNCDKFQS